MDCAQDSIIPVIVKSDIVVGLLWLILRGYLQRKIDSKFECFRFGGHGGYITIKQLKGQHRITFEKQLHLISKRTDKTPILNYES